MLFAIPPHTCLPEIIPGSFAPVQQSTHGKGDVKETSTPTPQCMAEKALMKGFHLLMLCQLSEKNEVLKVHPKQI